MKIQKIDVNYGAFELFHALRDQEHCFILDSSLQNQRLGRYSFMGCNPFLTFESKNGNITITEDKSSRSFAGDPFASLQELLDKYHVDNTGKLPFCGGAVGYFAYDMCHHVEKLPRTALDDIQVPDCWFGFYDSIIAVEHQEGAVYLVATGIHEEEETAISALQQKIDSLRHQDLVQPAGIACGEIESNFSKQDYMQAVQRIREYIRSGDIYQANMTQRFRCHTQEKPFHLYSRLRKMNPAPFACYIDFGQAQILSSSPERFIKIDESSIETRPIKGTRPRGKTPAEDQANKEELINSEKDRSELLMIVDLERNDLSRVSKTGTVKVPELFYLEEYATVHHLVSTVTGEMRADIKPLDVIKAAFPGGSITGAPKIRAMEVIDELEPTQRNIYTGSIGYIGFDGNVDLNIAIRTILLKDETAYFQAGGGIVWDSDPALEYEETLHKAKAIIKTLKNEK